jgi:hypothetical protein
MERKTHKLPLNTCTWAKEHTRLTLHTWDREKSKKNQVAWPRPHTWRSQIHLPLSFLQKCWRIKLVSTYDPQAYGPTPFSPRDSQGSCQSAEQGDC